MGVKILWCEDCDTFFSSEEAERIDRGFDYEYWGECGTHHDYRLCCPNCGGEDCWGAGECVICGEAVSPGVKYCAKCIGEANATVDQLAYRLEIDNSGTWDLINYIAEERG